MKPYVDKDAQYRPQWYAEMMYARDVPFKEAYYDNAIGASLDSFHALKRKIKLEQLLRSKQLYEQFRAKALSKHVKRSWRDRIKSYVP